MSITPDFIKEQIEKQLYEMSLHSDEERIEERISEGLLVSQLEFVLLQCEVIEQYSNDPRGESCLVLGYTNDNVPVHIVCGKKSMKKFIYYNCV